MIDILIVDDSNDKVANILKVIRKLSNDIYVNIAIDFISAQTQLISKQYDLLILDINLPIRNGEEPSLETGKNLLSEINRKPTIKSPFFIISLSQYSEECKDLSNIWQIVNYKAESNEWNKPIIEIIKHIIKCNFKQGATIEIKPTIFVEGKTDERILKESIGIFKPDLLDLITIRSETNAGASWVARQIIVWAHSLRRTDNYIKAVGLLDGDLAGKKATDEVKRVIKDESAESKTFKLIKLNPSYARHIIPIKNKGLDLPITLEEMFSISVWEYAKNQLWLEPRSNADSILTNPEQWNKFELSLKDYLQTLGLTEEESLFLNCVKNDCKEAFVQYILSLSKSEKNIALNSFKKLIDDISDYILK
ncbi:hypothetical protein P1X15_27415 [Runella sp. MFBS21]|uniref:hypothetical protein n=1 Tax=Runella sp. MFBS21 TaxID=3034018 RepID=UPI0023F85812|nr:hypothetical protein [Runella sp. MFBS21]MDF7821383.1 hypothetical protein [Runella sp. MFBS21]